jgi:uncharacterized membrane protein YhaH (DUF805 family)
MWLVFVGLIIVVVVIILAMVVGVGGAVRNGPDPSEGNKDVG